MSKFSVVPQDLVSILAPAFSNNPNTGAVIAEQVCRDDAAADVLQGIMAGEAITPRQAALLPPVMPGYSWENLAEQIRTVYQVNR